MLITGEHFLDLVKKNKKLSETIIPELIHRLVRETINTGAYTHFPANDDVFTPGFDGIVTGNTTEHRRRGVRDVNDGTLEFSLSEEYKKYQLYYQFTHPVTSKALEYISSGYNYEAETDRKRAYLGYE